MKKVMAILMLGVFLFGAALAGVSNVNTTEEKSNVQLMEKVYTFDEPQIKRSDGYTIVSLDGTRSIMDEGKPILPYKVDVIRFPLGTKVEVRAEKGNVYEKQLESKVKPYPMYTLMTTQGKLVMKEGAVYESNNPYPENWVETRTTVGLYNGERMVILSIFIYPCRYVASENKLIYTDSVKVDISYETSMPAANTVDTYDLLIIAPDDWMADLQPLKEHKESHGVKTIIVGLNEIYSGKYFTSQGRDEPEKIKYFIKDAVENWGVKYVMLVGGRQGGVFKERWLMPVRYTHLDDQSDWRQDISAIYTLPIYINMRTATSFLRTGTATEMVFLLTGQCLEKIPLICTPMSMLEG